MHLPNESLKSAINIQNKSEYVLLKHTMKHSQQFKLFYHNMGHLLFGYPNITQN